MAATHSGRFRPGHRLRTAAQFRNVFDRPVRSTDACLVILARRNGLRRARLGLAIARRYLPKACDRNRVKRLARESFRAHQAMLAGLDIVVLARAGTRQCGRRRLHESLRGHWRTLQRRCARS